MKNHLFGTITACVFSILTLHAQSAGAPAKAPIDVLTPAEKQHLEAAHQQALQAYPQLLQEEQRIQGEIRSMQNGAPISKEKIMSDFVAHRKQLEVYMVKVDPTVQPLLDKIHAAQSQAGTPGTSPAAPH